MNSGGTLYRVRDTLLGRLGFDITYVTTFATLSLGFSFRTTGRNNIPKTGPGLIIANHESFLDPLVVGLATRRPLYYFARKTLFKGAFGKFMRFFQAVPVEHHGVGKEGIKTVLEILAAGEVVVLFPEGTRSATGELQPLQPGVQLLLRRSNAPVIPVGIAGAYAAWPRTSKLPKFSPLFLPPTPRTLAVAVGRPIAATTLLQMDRENLLQHLQGEMRKAKNAAEGLRRK